MNEESSNNEGQMLAGILKSEAMTRNFSVDQNNSKMQKHGSGQQNANKDNNGIDEPYTRMTK